MQNHCKASFLYSLCRIMKLIKYNTIHKFSQTSNCLWDQKAISAMGSRARLSGAKVRCHGREEHSCRMRSGELEQRRRLSKQSPGLVSPQESLVDVGF